MSVAISWANKKQLAKCTYMVGFPISSHIYGMMYCLLPVTLHVMVPDLRRKSEQTDDIFFGTWPTMSLPLMTATAKRS